MPCLFARRKRRRIARRGPPRDIADASVIAHPFFSPPPDTTEPNANITSDDGVSTKRFPVPLTISFNENVNGLTLEDVYVAGVANATSLTQVSPDEYRLECTPEDVDLEGWIYVWLDAGAAEDYATNPSRASNNASVFYSNYPASVTLSSSDSDAGAGGRDVIEEPSISLSIQFSEPVTGFGSADLDVENGAVVSFSSSSSQAYSATVQAATDGLMSIVLPADSAINSKDVGNAVSNTLYFKYDTLDPAVDEFASGIADADSVYSAYWTNQQPIPVNVTFSEDVLIDGAGDAAKMANLFDTSGASYVELSAVASLNHEPFGDGGFFHALLHPSGAQWTAADGGYATSTIKVVASQAEDVVGRDNAASAATLSFYYDTARPSVAVNSSATEYTNVSPIPVSLDFNEPMYSGVAASDLVVTNGQVNATAFDASGNPAFALEVTPAGEGAVTIRYPNRAGYDRAGNLNTGSNTLVRYYDITAPNATLTTTVEPYRAGAPEDVLHTRVSPIPVHAQWSEPVVGFGSGDPSVVGGGVTAFAEDGGGTDEGFQMSITPSGEGAIAVALPQGVCEDRASTPSLAGAQTLYFVFDTSRPTAEISANVSTPTRLSPMLVDFVFSEAVLGFEVANVVAQGAAAPELSDFEALNATHYSVVATPTQQGAMVIGVLDGVYGSPEVTDFAGNYLEEPRFVNVTYDSVDVEAELTRGYPDAHVRDGGVMYANFAPIEVALEFSEPVYGLTAGDLELEGGGTPLAHTLADTSGGDATGFSVQIAPGAQGALNATLPFGVAEDLAGNPTLDTDVLLFVYDTVEPTATVTSTAPYNTNTSPVPFALALSERCFTVAEENFTVTNGALSNLVKLSESSYTFDVTPGADGPVRVSLNGAAVTDLAANDNQASNTLERNYDSTHPVVALNSTTPKETNSASVTVLVTFSTPVLDFAAEDLSISGGAVRGSNATALGAGRYHSQFEVDLDFQGEGEVTVQVAQSVTTDLALNPNLASDALDFVFDTTAPQVSINSSYPDPTNEAPVEFLIEFDEAVVDFGASVLSVSGGTVASVSFPQGYADSEGVTGDAASLFLVAVTPASTEALVNVTIPAGAVTDQAGNYFVDASSASRQYDFVRPTVGLSSESDFYTNENPVPLRVLFSEPVYGFAADALTLGGAGGTVANFHAHSASNYSADVYVDTSGAGDASTLTVQVLAGEAEDAAANNNTASAVLTRHLEQVRPGVELACASRDCVASDGVFGVPTGISGAPISVLVSFGSAVYGLAASDFDVDNGAAGSLSALSASNYSVQISPAAEGVVGVSLPAGAVADLYDNLNTASELLNFTYDSTPPNATLTSKYGGFETNISPVVARLDFGEDVVAASSEGLLTVHFAYANGTRAQAALGAAPDAAARTVEVEIYPEADADLTLRVAAGRVEDVAGQLNVQSAAYVVRYDVTAPTAQLSSDSAQAPDSTPDATIAVRADFSEDMASPLPVEDVSEFLNVTNAAVSNLRRVASDAFAWDLTPRGDGEVRVSVVAGAAQDLAENDCEASAELVFVSDKTPPTAALSTARDGFLRFTPALINVSFSEQVESFGAGDVSVVGDATVVAVQTLEAGPAFQLSLRFDSEGDVSLFLAADAVDDLAGNGLERSASVNFTYDVTNPTASLSVDAITTESPVPFALSFSEDVTGVTASALNVTGGTISSIQPSSGFADSFVVYVTPEATVATVEVALEAGGRDGAVMDRADNSAGAASKASAIYDVVHPLVSSLQSAAGADTNLAPIELNITFSEEVGGLSLADFEVSGGSAQSLSPSGDASFYTFEVLPSGEGEVTVRLPADAVADRADNNATGSQTLTFNFDTTRPNVTLSGDEDEAPTAIKARTVGLTLASSEVLFGMALADFSIAGDAYVSGLQSDSDGDVYTLDVIPTADGTVTIFLPGDAAIDAANNFATASNTLEYDFDVTNPVVNVSSSQGAAYSAVRYTNESPIDFAATATEDVYGFALSALDVSGASAANSSALGSPADDFELQLAPDGEGSISVLVSASAVEDAAGNANAASNTLRFVYDTSPPSLVISTDQPARTADDEIDVTFTFSESVDYFALADITVTNGQMDSAAGLSANADNSTFTATVLPSVEGNVTVSVAAQACQDYAANGNSASNTLTRFYDTTPPEPTLSSSEAEGETNEDSIPLSISFSEQMTGFTASDIYLGGTASASVGALTNVGWSSTSFTVTLSVSSEGTLDVSIPQGVAVDQTNVLNVASNTLSWEYDITSPEVQLSAPAAYVNYIPTITAEWTEEVFGFSPDDLSAHNADLAAGFASGSDGDSEFTLVVTPSSQGEVLLSKPAGGVTDGAGNAAAASSTLSFVYDTVPPEATLTAPTAAYETEDNQTFAIRVSPISVTYNFGETVVNATADGVVLAEGVGAFGGDLNVSIAGSGGSGPYVASVVPGEEGTFTVVVPTDAVQDLAANDCERSNVLTFSFDTTEPTPSLATSDGSVYLGTRYITGDAFNVTVLFDEALRAFDASDVSLTNAQLEGAQQLSASAASAAGAAEAYELALLALSEGDVEVGVAGAIVLDLAGNSNAAASAELELVYDATAPTAALSAINVTTNSPSSDPSSTPQHINEPSVALRVDFSTPVVGFTASDVGVVNGATDGAASLAADSDEAYEFAVRPSGQGAVNVSLPAGAATDFATNPSEAAEVLMFVYDTVAPELFLNSSSPAINNDPVFEISLEASEGLYGLSLDDLEISNAAASNLQGGDGDEFFSFDLVPQGEGYVTLYIGGGEAVQDEATNGALASNTLVFLYDTTRPFVSVLSSARAYTNAYDIDVAVHFSEEPSAAFGASAFSLSNAAAGGLASSNETAYTLTLNPLGEGTLTVQLASGSVVDLADNPIPGSNVLSII